MLLASVRVLRNEDASALPSSAFTNNPPTSTAPTSAPLSSPSNSSTTFLAVGLSIGFLFLGATILFAFLYKRRSRRKRDSIELDVDAHLSTPQFIVPSTTWPIVGKQPLPMSKHRIQTQPEESEVSSSVPSSPGPRSMGLPPSYESHFQPLPQ